MIQGYYPAGLRSPAMRMGLLERWLFNRRLKKRRKKQDDLANLRWY